MSEDNENAKGPKHSMLWELLKDICHALVDEDPLVAFEVNVTETDLRIMNDGIEKCQKVLMNIITKCDDWAVFIERKEKSAQISADCATLRDQVLTVYEIVELELIPMADAYADEGLLSFFYRARYALIVMFVGVALHASPLIISAVPTVAATIGTVVATVSVLPLTLPLLRELMHRLLRELKRLWQKNKLQKQKLEKIYQTCMILLGEDVADDDEESSASPTAQQFSTNVMSAQFSKFAEILRSFHQELLRIKLDVESNDVDWDMIKSRVDSLRESAEESRIMIIFRRKLTKKATLGIVRRAKLLFGHLSVSCFCNLSHADL